MTPSPSGSAKVRERSHSSASHRVHVAEHVAQQVGGDDPRDATPRPSRRGGRASSSDSASRRISARTISGGSAWRAGDQSGSTPRGVGRERERQRRALGPVGELAGPLLVVDALGGQQRDRLGARQRARAPSSTVRLSQPPSDQPRLGLRGGRRSRRSWRPAAPAAPRGAGSRRAPPCARRSRSAPAGRSISRAAASASLSASGTGGRSRASTSHGGPAGRLAAALHMAQQRALADTARPVHEHHVRGRVVDEQGVDEAELALAAHERSLVAPRHARSRASECPHRLHGRTTLPPTGAGRR